MKTVVGLARFYAKTEDDGIVRLHSGDTGTLVIAGKRVRAKIVSDGEVDEEDRIKFVITVPKKTLMK